MSTTTGWYRVTFWLEYATLSTIVSAPYPGHELEPGNDLYDEGLSDFIVGIASGSLHENYGFDLGLLSGAEKTVELERKPDEFGYSTGSSVVCVSCADESDEPIMREGYPDGFTCDDCGSVVTA